MCRVCRGRQRVLLPRLTPREGLSPDARWRRKMTTLRRKGRCRPIPPSRSSSLGPRAASAALRKTGLPPSAPPPIERARIRLVDKSGDVPQVGHGRTVPAAVHRQFSCRRLNRLRAEPIVLLSLFDCSPSSEKAVDEKAPHKNRGWNPNDH